MFPTNADVMTPEGEGVVQGNTLTGVLVRLMEVIVTLPATKRCPEQHVHPMREFAPADLTLKTGKAAKK